MVARGILWTIGIFGLIFLLSNSALAQTSPVDYDIIYVRAPRYGDDTNTLWQEVFNPIQGEPGTDLMLLHPDGSEEVLVAGGNGAIVDPTLSFDGTSVYYAKYPDLRRERPAAGRGLASG